MTSNSNQFSEKFKGLDEYIANSPRNEHKKEFLAIKNDIQIAINKNFPKKQIYNWCVANDLFSGAYCTFNNLIRRYDMHKQTEEEIEELKKREAFIGFT